MMLIHEMAIASMEAFHDLWTLITTLIMHGFPNDSNVYILGRYQKQMIDIIILIVRLTSNISTSLWAVAWKERASSCQGERFILQLIQEEIDYGG